MIYITTPLLLLATLAPSPDGSRLGRAVLTPGDAGGRGPAVCLMGAVGVPVVTQGTLARDKQRFDLEASNISKESYVAEVRHLGERIQPLDKRIAEFAASIDQADLVRAFQALKGIKVLTTATIVAEIGDLKRFATAKQFASLLGLTPSEHSGGSTRKRGSNTKAGNRRLR